MAPSVEAITQRWVARHLPARPVGAHKGDFGRVLVLAGSIEYPGAALLASLGAMRAGAAGARPGLTWLPLAEEAPGLIAPGGWRRVTTEAGRYDAVVVGPGLGAQPSTRRRARQLISALTVPAVIDADGLNALADAPRWWQTLQAPVVLTPHPGEFARLSGEAAPPSDDDDARAGSAADAAARWGAVVVLKGAHTVVADPGGSVLAS